MKKTIAIALAAISLTAALPVFASTTASTTVTADVHATTKPPVKNLKKTLQGMVKQVGTNSLTFTVGSTDYTVSTTASTQVVNRAWKKIALSSVKVGDKVRVYAAFNGTATVTASIVRDISM